MLEGALFRPLLYMNQNYPRGEDSHGEYRGINHMSELPLHYKRTARTYWRRYDGM